MGPKIEGVLDEISLGHQCQLKVMKEDRKMPCAGLKWPNFLTKSIIRGVTSSRTTPVRPPLHTSSMFESSKLNVRTVMLYYLRMYHRLFIELLLVKFRLNLAYDFANRYVHVQHIMILSNLTVVVV